MAGWQESVFRRWLILRSGVMALGSYGQDRDEGREERFVPFPRVVNELEETEAEGQLLLGDPPMRLGVIVPVTDRRRAVRARTARARRPAMLADQREALRVIDQR